MELRLPRLVINLKGKVRKVTFNGRPHYVAPMTLIVSGVLPGSRGPVYYPEDELGEDPAIWNHVPMVVYHPMMNGQYVTARDPDMLETCQVGLVFNARYEGGKLRADGYFDIERTRSVDERVLAAIERGEPIELSTGLSAQIEEHEDREHNGMVYNHTAYDYRPDHLAILPDQTGACSLKDGCGVLANRRAGWTTLGIVVNPRGQWQAPQSGSAPAGVKKILRRVYSQWRDKHPSEDPATKERGARIAWGAVRKAGWRKGADGKWHRKKSTTNSRHSNRKDNVMPVRWVNVENYDKSYGDRHSELAQQLYERFNDAYVVELYDDYLVYTRGRKTYKLPYTEKDGHCTLSDAKPVEVSRTIVYEPIKNERTGDNMAKSLSNLERQATIHWLVTNCDCWKGQGDEDLLANFSDEKLVQLKSNAEKGAKVLEVANTAVRGFQHNGSAYRYNPKTGAWEMGQLGQGGQNVTNKGGKLAKKAAESTAGDDTDDNDDDSDFMDDYPKSGDKKKATRNSRVAPRADKPKTREELLKSLPQDLQNELRQANELVQREKDSIITQLLTNVADHDRAAHKEWMQQQDISILRNMLAIQPKQPAGGTATRPATGRKAAGVTNAEDQDLLRLPSFDWQTISNGADESQPRPAAGGNGAIYEEGAEEAGNGLSEDEWLQSAPPHIRNRYLQGVGLYESERRRLIDQIVNSITDEEKAERMARRLQDKSIEEVRDIADAMSVKEDRVVQNYFGGSAPATLYNAGNDDRGSDILTIPAMDYTELSGLPGVRKKSQ